MKRNRVEQLDAELQTMPKPAAKKIKSQNSTHDPEWTPRAAPLDFLSESPWELPAKSNQISSFDQNQIARDALETNVILHPRLPQLFSSFLEFKRKRGSNLEQGLYAQMNAHDLAARLIKKRALHFTNASDFTVLRDKRVIPNAHQDWLRVGKDDEGEIHLKDYLSYDEMMLSSLIGSSGPTFFINTGARNNAAKIDESKLHQKRGIIVGLVGNRFHATGQIDHPICGLGHNKKSAYAQDPRLTKIFRDFFDPDSTPEGVKMYDAGYFQQTFDKSVYKGRIRISIETALLEADSRAAAEEVKAHLFLAGLGLGVWRELPQQLQWYFEEVAACLKRLDPKHVNVLELGWDHCPPAVKDKLMATGAEHGIKVLVSSKRDPCAKLSSNDLLVRWSLIPTRSCSCRRA
ncbi:hypothetical protein CB0940_03148 [Cercospora beticola]|uniref:Uncharacterized protein n=1 Tax=Cercospora beticola TaxID=122368 RepID=A0A2G5I3B9_CERBT|nr:hypothetical protein CB0940_03148 [Cercospora beticola]PIA99238.1 hypothetical protein CB0940_03148 [Cercospora beticola]WPB00318.1 hypothetical protein RHO25_004937 [Cercospora beticola]CAK1361479.1 unnamed protein product [Cercospora beticola]